jgi:hypothetical protein
MLLLLLGAAAATQVCGARRVCASAKLSERPSSFLVPSQAAAASSCSPSPAIAARQAVANSSNSSGDVDHPAPRRPCTHVCPLAPQAAAQAGCRVSYSSNTKLPLLFGGVNTGCQGLRCQPRYDYLVRCWFADRGDELNERWWRWSCEDAWMQQLDSPSTHTDSAMAQPQLPANTQGQKCGARDGSSWGVCTTQQATQALGEFFCLMPLSQHELQWRCAVPPLTFWLIHWMAL